MTHSPDAKLKSKNVAVALKYDHAEKTVPQVVAIGRGLVASRIVETAEASGVPVQQNAVLARALAELNLEQAIPSELYKAVATVIGFLIKQRQLR